MAERLLTLVLPAYKQEKTIVKDINNLVNVLSTLPLKYELIVVVDGFVDKTYKRAKSLELRSKHPTSSPLMLKFQRSRRLRGASGNQRTKTEEQGTGSLKVLGYPENQGKGFAIKYGVKEAKGDIIGYIDAGMDLDPKEIKLMLDIMDWNNADIVLGSKLHPDSKVNYPTFRKILSFGYRSLVKILFRFDVKDTQVGLKIYRKKIAKEVFPKIVVKRFAFDVEVLAVARSFGYSKIYEAPIKLRFRPGSITSVNFLRTITLMLVDTFAVFYRMHFLHFYKK